MKKLVAFVIAASVSTAVYAACTTHSYWLNGKLVTCTTCCYGGNCTTNCY